MDTREKLKALVELAPNVNCPASSLQMHDDVIVIVDEAAGSLLTK